MHSWLLVTNGDGTYECLSFVEELQVDKRQHCGMRKLTKRTGFFRDFSTSKQKKMKAHYKIQVPFNTHGT